MNVECNEHLSCVREHCLYRTSAGSIDCASVESACVVKDSYN